MDVNSVEEYLKQIQSLDKKPNETIFYRGQSNGSHNLTPFVFRGSELYKEEHVIYTEIMTECAHEFDDCKLHNEILSKMQHYGVPTRLLDVTTNALVALYFACDVKKGESNNGAVYVMKTEKTLVKQFDSDTISILASLPRFNYEEKVEMLKLANDVINEHICEDCKIIKFNKEKLIKRLLHEIKKEKPAFENVINPKDIINNYFFIPRKNNARIIRQSGAFIIFGLGIEEMIIDGDNICKYASNKITISTNDKKILLTNLIIIIHIELL